MTSNVGGKNNFVQQWNSSLDALFSNPLSKVILAELFTNIVSTVILSNVLGESFL